MFGFEKKKTVAERYGESYENAVYKALVKYTGGTVLRNVLIPWNQSSARKTEVDMVYICRKGIFPIECKFRETNRKPGKVASIGLIRSWEVYTGFANSNGPIIKFIPNPWIQNAIHARLLKMIINQAGMPFKNYYNVVCTTVDSFLAKDYDNLQSGNFIIYPEEHCIALASTPSAILSRDNSVRDFTNWISNLNDVYTEDEVERLINIIQNYVGTPEELEERSTALQYEHDVKELDEW